MLTLRAGDRKHLPEHRPGRQNGGLCQTPCSCSTASDLPAMCERSGRSGSACTPHLGINGELPPTPLPAPATPVAAFSGDFGDEATACPAMSCAKIAAYGLGAASSSSEGFPVDPVGLVRSGVAAGLSGRESPPAT